MQATVHSFDPDTLSGTVVTDDGVLVPLSPQAFEESALLTLRQGQRLIVVISGVGAQARVSQLGIETVGMVPERPSRP
jgi:2-phospho-L-lactate guanylyltransferase